MMINLYLMETYIDKMKKCNICKFILNDHIVKLKKKIIDSYGQTIKMVENNIDEIKNNHEQTNNDYKKLPNIAPIK